MNCVEYRQNLAEYFQQGGTLRFPLLQKYEEDRTNPDKKTNRHDLEELCEYTLYLERKIKQLKEKK